MSVVVSAALPVVLLGLSLVTAHQPIARPSTVPPAPSSSAPEPAAPVVHQLPGVVNGPPPGRPVKEELPPGMTSIEGRLNPELIPDHAIWRMIFLKISDIKRQGDEADFAYILPLGKADLAALYVEADKQFTRDEACTARYAETQQSLAAAGRPQAAIWPALDQVLIECRTLVLDAADRVMDAVSDEGRRILADYAERRRHSMSMLVIDRELPTYRLPR